MSKSDTYNSGRLAEWLALFYLISRGYFPVGKNVVTGKGTHAGEVDLIVRKGKLLVFVEVKKRQNLEKAAYAISERQKQRIIRGAEAFLKKHKKYDAFDIRFDAVLVEFPWHIQHLTNAWISTMLF